MNGRNRDMQRLQESKHMTFEAAGARGRRQALEHPVGIASVVHSAPSDMHKASVTYETLGFLRLGGCADVARLVRSSQILLCKGMPALRHMLPL